LLKLGVFGLAQGLAGLEWGDLTWSLPKQIDKLDNPAQDSSGLLMVEKIKIGSVVIFSPGESTKGHTDLHPKYGPKIGHVYRVKKINDEGLLYFENEFGPFLDSDVKLVAKPELMRVDVPLPMPPLEVLLKESGMTVPIFHLGQKVVFPHAWATSEVAQKVGWPIANQIYEIESIEDDGMAIRLVGLKQRFASWHFKSAG